MRFKLKITLTSQRITVYKKKKYKNLRWKKNTENKNKRFSKFIVFLPIGLLYPTHSKYSWLYSTDEIQYEIKCKRLVKYAKFEGNLADEIL